ncbi:MAG TPA: ferredoxin [Nocardioides sp.]|uniref:ferredoxin n=1 Tax=uncultured Nocardioides sp. TaxID=198441 RepID=UPI000EEA56AA|nr:ferredoxin [uncultured Nocardioides sp.]HCB06663.1 ferredoxin [Nocardioides sp.]HRD63573.1 ferredoxin [Nocardioides sp.]HRI98937.1 ferredoxin [Nocardioides sp.]
MKIEVDWTRCDGHGLCARLLPELIVADELGFPVFAERGLTGDLLLHARRAVAVCPALALRLERPEPNHTVR